ncbi:OLC1v1011406C1 [Oldenlandia corymbosa var. corymbosa]|uniref:OLC1v1011406C1 n=1 Tax=Oldenlandia corymbosa var. corymbosa TaxID=529605 RepID=A0AAV1DVZ0_OLDCO|nr:OLC1v1011406C1 [Oldenlandia corymbosa var. corymbosa]
MKSLSNDNNNNNCSQNWLGFSLSPQMNNMEEGTTDHHHPQPLHCTTHNNAVSSSSVQLSFSHPSPHFNYSGIYCGMEGDNHAEAGFYPSLTVMPLKSDGSLCIMEAMNRSQPQGMASSSSTSTPKLENFFGGTTMGTHHYEAAAAAAGERGGPNAMALSLDSMYYHQTLNHHHEPNSQDFFNSSRQHQIQVQQYAGYSAFRGNNGFHQTSQDQGNKEAEPGAPTNLALPALPNNDPSGLKNWGPRNYLTDQGSLEQKLIGCIVENGGESGCISAAIGYGDLQSLSLSMSPGSQSSCVTGSHSQQISPTVTECVATENKKRGPEKSDQKQIVHRKSIDTFGQRTSQYRGVTRHRWTGRYEAHLWDNSCKKEGQSRKGRQGGYDMEEKAARAYDLAALKYWGPSTHINFPLENYQQEVEEMKNMSRQEYVAHLRRKSSGFSRGASIYRGVTRHHQHGRWQARIGRVAGNKDLYLGTFTTQEEAAEAYDVAAIKFRGVNAVTNFDISRYDVERIMASNTLLAGDLARRNKNLESSNNEISVHENPSNPNPKEEAANVTRENNDNALDWSMALHQFSQPLQKPNPLVEGFRTSSNNYPMAINALMGIETLDHHNAHHHHQQEFAAGSGKMIAHFSEASSLVTSVSCSREGSPDKNNNLQVHFAMPQAAIASSSSNSKLHSARSPPHLPNSWISTAQLRPHVPIFASWTDAS